ncbi:MAG: hypothetical protein ACI8Y7_000513 [Candidatus Woesearchaeota archaeon]|jgi:hypothetical protein
MIQNKKGQSALEFLATYGWAFLVILIMIGALAYFGVLDPSQFLPEKCVFGTGIGCTDNNVDVGGQVVTLVLQNGFPKDLSAVWIDAANLTVTGCTGTAALANSVCVLDTPNGFSLDLDNAAALAGTGTGVTWPAASQKSFTINLLANSAIAGDTISVRVDIGYRQAGSQFAKSIEGIASLKAQ